MNTAESQFFEFLMSKKKDYIKKYSVDFSIDVKARYCKKEMAYLVADYLLNESARWMMMLPMNEIDILDKLAKHKAGYRFNAGYQPYDTILAKYGLAATEEDQYGNTLFYLSPEMLKVVKKGFKSTKDWMEKRGFNEYEIYTMGVLATYGVIELDSLFEILTAVEFELEKDDPERPFGIIAYLFIEHFLPCRIYRMEVNERVYIHHPCIDNPRQIIEEQNSFRYIKDYKEFPLEEFYQAGLDSPFCTAGMELPECLDFVKYLNELSTDDYLSVPDYHTFFLLAQNNDEIMLDVNMDSRTTNRQKLNVLGRKARRMSKVIPQWSLKGYSKKELETIKENVGKTLSTSHGRYHS